MLMRRADLFIVYCVTLLPELNVTEDATNGLRPERGGRSGLSHQPNYVPNNGQH